jgi:hypothetical protein
MRTVGSTDVKPQDEMPRDNVTLSESATRWSNLLGKAAEKQKWVANSRFSFEEQRQRGGNV